MADVNDIKAAVELMDVKDDAQWNADGSPKLEVVRENLKDPKVTRDEVLTAIGEFRRTKEPTPPPEQAVKAAPTGDDRPDEVTVPPTTDPTEILINRLVEARQVRDSIDKEIADEEAQKSASDRRIAQLRAVQDRAIDFIEANESQVSHAEAVKRIQAQTQARLAGQVVATAAMADALKSSGMTVFPSRLDQTMALRKRTPEQQANYAKFVHQNAAHVSAARG